MEADAEGRNLYHFLLSAVAPRPIAWVTTRSRDGVVNAAPFSWFQAVSGDPPVVMLSIADRPDGTRKDTLANIEATGEFVVNAAPLALVDAMVQSSGDYPSDVSETEAVGLATVPSVRVAPPRLAASPVHLECRLDRVFRYETGGRGTTVVFGRVVYVAADDAVLDARGNVDPRKLTFAARMGGRWYASTKDIFEKQRPDVSGGPPKGS